MRMRSAETQPSGQVNCIQEISNMETNDNIPASGRTSPQSPNELIGQPTQQQQQQAQDDTIQRDQIPAPIEASVTGEENLCWSSGSSSVGCLSGTTSPFTLGESSNTNHNNNTSTKPQTTNDNQSTSSISQSAKAKLRSATRALLFFRHKEGRPKKDTKTYATAGKSLFSRSVDHCSGTTKASSRSSERAVSRQETSDSLSAQLTGGLAYNRSKFSSMSSFSNFLTNTTTANSTPKRASVIQNGSNGNTTATPATNELPTQFIVPKMNALKLPIVCRIRSLEGELMREVFVHRYELGQYLIESLKVSVGIKDSKYFGLKLAKSVDDQEDPRQPWLDLNESVCKQIKQHSSFMSPTANWSSQQSARSVDFYLRVKYYPPNLIRAQDSFLRQYLWLQLRRDLRLGKLTSSMNNLTLLMACVLQHELGDYKPELVDRLPEWNILPNQDLIEEQALIVWRTRLSGALKHQVQMQFLRAAVILETYGFDYYPVRDHQRQRGYLLGFNYAGIKTIRNGRIVHHFRWHSLSKIAYERRMIIFHIYPTENSKRKQILGFKCLTNDDCQNLYMRLLEQKYFFTVDLAYFDKSIRRPSYLHSSLDQLDMEQDQAPANHWQASTSGRPPVNHSPAGNTVKSYLAKSSSLQEHPKTSVRPTHRLTRSKDSRESNSVESGSSSSIFEERPPEAAPQSSGSQQQVRPTPVLVRQSAARSASNCPTVAEYCAYCALNGAESLDTSNNPSLVDVVSSWPASLAVANGRLSKAISRAAHLIGSVAGSTIASISSLAVTRSPHGLTGERLLEFQLHRTQTPISESPSRLEPPEAATEAANREQMCNNHHTSPKSRLNNQPEKVVPTILKLMLALFVMNFLLRLTDGLSNMLIQLLSLPSTATSQQSPLDALYTDRSNDAG